MAALVGKSVDLWGGACLGFGSRFRMSVRAPELPPGAAVDMFSMTHHVECVAILEFLAKAVWPAVFRVCVAGDILTLVALI